MQLLTAETRQCDTPAGAQNQIWTAAAAPTQRWPSMEHQALCTAAETGLQESRGSCSSSCIN